MPPEVKSPRTDPILQNDSTMSGKEEVVSLPMRECMLDMFPLSEEELDRVLQCYRNYGRDGGTFSLMLQDQKSEDGNFIQRVNEVEQRLLPESASIIRQALSHAFVIGSDHDDSDQFKFLEAVVSLLGRRGARSLLQILYDVVATDCGDGPVTPESLISLVRRLLLASHCLKTKSLLDEDLRPTSPQAWVSSLSERGQDITLAIWVEWVNSIAPQVYQTLSTFCHYAIFTPSCPFRSTCQPLSLPQIDQECALWKHSYQTIPSSLALLSPNLGGKWTRQYSSDCNGFNFNTFQQALLGYQGATVILIQTVAGDAFGYYSNRPWKESKKWFGDGSDSFLFGLQPSLQFYAPTGGGKNFNMYLNNPVSPRPGDLTGLAIGGINEKAPRLHITTTLEQCKASSMDGVYDCGPLLANGELFFDVDVMEVWAVNATEEQYAKLKQAGAMQAELREGNRIKAAQVDRAHFLEDFQSGAVENSLFTHREQARGRHSFCADADGRGYFIDNKEPSTRNFQKQESSNSDLSGVYIDDN